MLCWPILKRHLTVSPTYFCETLKDRCTFWLIVLDLVLSQWMAAICQNWGNKIEDLCSLIRSASGLSLCQGNLGPLLLLVYINEIISRHHSINFLLFFAKFVIWKTSPTPTYRMQLMIWPIGVMWVNFISMLKSVKLWHSIVNVILYQLIIKVWEFHLPVLPKTVT